MKNRLLRIMAPILLFALCVPAFGAPPSARDDAPTSAQTPRRDARSHFRLHGDWLTVEQRAREERPETTQGLEIGKEFSRRLPAHWGELELSARQKEGIYRLQEEYFREIVQLQARAERLAAERDAKMRDVLTERQLKKLDASTLRRANASSSPSTTRNKSKSATNAKKKSKSQKNSTKKKKSAPRESQGAPSTSSDDSAS